MTKLEKILTERNLSQGDLMRLIKEKHNGFKMGRDRISKLYTGRLTNPTIETMKKVAKALDVSIDDVIDN